MTTGTTAHASPRPTFVRTPLPERLCNLGRLVDTLERRGMDGLVSYLRPNVLYLSGFAPPASASVHETNGYAAVVLSRHAPEAPVLVVAEFDLAHVLGQPSWVKDARPYATLLTPLDVSWGPAPLDRFVPAGLLATQRAQHARRHYAPSLVEAVRRAMRDRGLARATVGFDDLRLAAVVAGPDVRVVDAYGALKHVRQVKTPEEVRLLREATRLNQAAIEGAIATWSRGMTWAEMTRTYHTTAVALGGFVRDPGAWPSDPRFRTGADRFQHREFLTAEIQNALGRDTKERWMERLEEAGVPCAPVLTIAEALAHPQVEALDILQPVPGLPLTVVGLPVSFDGGRPPVRTAAPRLGQHNGEVLPE